MVGLVSKKNKGIKQHYFSLPPTSKGLCEKLDGVAKYKNEFKYLKKSDLLAKDKLLSAFFLGHDYVFSLNSQVQKIHPYPTPAEV